VSVLRKENQEREPAEEEATELVSTVARKVT